MMKITYIILLFCCLCLVKGMAQTWHSELVSYGLDGKLQYMPDEDGFVIPDFSHAGYMGGGVDLPVVEVVKEISPVSGDNTQHIQSAIDELYDLELNRNGIRGALLLKAGIYEVYGTINVNCNGVVVRGVGQGSDSLTSTIIYAKGNTPNQRDVIVVGNNLSRVSGASEIGGTRTYITDEKVDVGSYSFHVEDATDYNIGDRISIYHPASENWLKAINYGGVPYPDPSSPDNPDERWKEGKLPVLYNRIVTNINGNEITINAPLFYTLLKSVSGSYVFKPNLNGLYRQIGLENLRVDIETLGGEDEAHAWNAVRFKSCENVWAKDCMFEHFGLSGIITEACTRSSFIGCSALNPVAIVTGARMYNFNTYSYSQLNLFEDCYASNGRHHYVSNGTSTTSGNVFLNCTSDRTNSVSEGHRQWTQGMLYDNHKEINMRRSFVLGLYNRVAMGTGHGWSAVHSVLWNCDVDASYGVIGLQKPPTAQNYAIGCSAKKVTGMPVSSSNFTIGYVEGLNKPDLEPASLYRAQLNDRLANTIYRKPDITSPLDVFQSQSGTDITVQTELNGFKTYRIIDLSGRTLYEESTNAKLLTIQSVNMNKGIYLLECQYGTERLTTKFIKQ